MKECRVPTDKIGCYILRLRPIQTKCKNLDPICGPTANLSLRWIPPTDAMGFAGANATHLFAPAGIAAIAFDNSSIPQFAFPADNDPFATYAMYAAIFQQAKRPETAKLYVNWLLERESPNNQGNIWSVRRDMTPRQGFRPVWEYTNSNHSAFLAFMEDYEQREHFSRQIDLFFGATTCDTAPLEPSLAPTSQ